MNKRLISFIIFIFLPLLLVTGFSSWIIVGEKSATVGKTASTTNVCYINTDSTGNQYTRIEKALEVAKEGDTVYVKPGLKNTDNTTSLEIRIYKDCTIKSGVTLCLPYVTSTGSLDHYEETVWGTTQTFSDTNITSKNKYRNTLVVLSAGVTLTVNSGARLEIGGIFGIQSNPISGIVNGSYCEIAMEENSSIVSFGTVDCYGMIKEYDYLNNGSKLEIKRGTINFPFAIYDFKGGTKSFELSGPLASPKIAPFNQFDISNIQSTLRIHSGVSAKAEYRLYMNESQIRGKCNFIGSSSTNTLFILTSGYIDLKYTTETLGYTTLTQIIGQTTISINGNVTFGSILIDIKVYISTTLKTSDYHMPISYKFLINIEDGSTMIIPNKLKLLQGSKVHIKKGGTVQISNEVFGFESYDPTGLTDNGLNVTYPISLTKSQIINDGYLMIDSNGKLALNVESSVTGAILDVGSSSNDISFTLKGENYTASKDMYLNGTLDGSSSPSSLNTNVYVSQSSFKWKAFTGSYTLNYNKTYTNTNDEFENSVPFTGHNEATTAITLTGTTKERTLTSSYANDGEYKFFGWYFDEQCTERIVDNIVYGSQLIGYANSNNTVDIYAKFTKAPLIDILYYGSVSSTGIDVTKLVDNTSRQTIAVETISQLGELGKYYNIENEEMKIYKFTGWNIMLTYKDGTVLEYYGDANSKFTIPKDYNGDSIIVKAAEYTYDYSMYALIVEGSVGYITESSLSTPAYFGETTISTAKTYYVMPDTTVSFTIRVGQNALKKTTTKCVISGTITDEISITARGSIFSPPKKSHEFTMPSGYVKLTFSHTE